MPAQHSETAKSDPGKNRGKTRKKRQKQNEQSSEKRVVAKQLEMEVSYDKKIGEKLRQYRKSQGLTQAELAGKLGITYQQVQKFERGINRVGAGRLQLIANTLGIPPKYFFPDCEFRMTPEHQGNDEIAEYLDITSLSVAKQRFINAALALADEDLKMLMPLIKGLRNKL